VKEPSVELKWFAYGENLVILRNWFNLLCFKGGSVLLLDDVTGSAVWSPIMGFCSCKSSA